LLRIAERRSLANKHHHAGWLPQPLWGCPERDKGGSQPGALVGAALMDVFSFRDRVVDDYGQFSRSFTQIKAPDLRDFVDGRYGAGEYWPSPLIQLNPSVVGGGSISQLVQQGLLHPECSRIFRWGKAASNQGRGDGWSCCCTAINGKPSRSPAPAAAWLRCFRHGLRVGPG
jgi:hypothetical protein